jgi:hypothetical protein
VKYTTWNAAATRTGPNDMQHVVWATSKSSFSFFLVFSCFMNTNYYIQVVTSVIHDMGGAATRTGPNDTSRVVWAISKSLFLYILVFKY